jgi:hypothetical protein
MRSWVSDGRKHTPPPARGWRYNKRQTTAAKAQPVRRRCVAVIALTAFLPGHALLDYGLVDPGWILLPDETLTAFVNTFTPCDEQPLPLLSLVSSRGPPSVPLA